MTRSIQSISVVVCGLVLGGCRPSGDAESANQPRALPSAPAAESDASAAPAVPGPAPPDAGASASCPEPSAGTLAYVRCDADRIELAHPVAFHPGRSIPPEPARAVLDRVAALLRERTDILLVRVEAYSSRRVGASAEERRREIADSQARADAVLSYLWRRGGISAERLEAVGYGADARFSEQKERWPVVLRILQRAKAP